MISTRFILLALTLCVVALSSVDAQHVLRGRVVGSGGRRRGLKSAKADSLGTTKTLKSSVSIEVSEPASDRESITVEILESPKGSKAAKSEEVVTVTIGEEERPEIAVNREAPDELMEGIDYPRESPLKSLAPSAASTD